MAIGMALRTGVRVVSVDYRMPPDHPFPAALDDAMAVYRALLKSFAPENIVVGGVSAGGGLTAALALRARDEGVPMPAGLVLMTLGVALTISGDTFHTLLGIDPALPTPVSEMFQLYAGDTPLDHPYVSPVLGHFDASFPPTFLQSGTRDLLLSSTVRMHRALFRWQCAGAEPKVEQVILWSMIGCSRIRYSVEHLSRLLLRKRTSRSARLQYPDCSWAARIGSPA